MTLSVIKPVCERPLISITQSMNTANSITPMLPLWKAVVYPEVVDIAVGKACRSNSADGASGLITILKLEGPRYGAQYCPYAAVLLDVVDKTTV